MTEFGTTLLALGPTAPLVLALLGIVTPHPVRLLPWAAAPGLIAALFVPSDAFVFLPGILLGVSLRLDPVGGVLLGFASFLWICAGAYASAYLGARLGSGVSACSGA
jgi:hypothetical protein